MLPAFVKYGVAMVSSKIVFAISMKIDDMLEESCRNTAAMGTTVRDCRNQDLHLKVAFKGGRSGRNVGLRIGKSHESYKDQQDTATMFTERKRTAL